MIRINLTPSRKRSASPRTAAAGTTAGQLWLLGWLVGWVALIGLGWWVLALKDGDTQELRQVAAQVEQQAQAIKAEIDEEGLDAKKRELEQLQAAIAKLEKKKRTPVYVMYDLATILTDPAMDSSDPPKLDIDEVKLRQLLKEDPRAGINPRWDSSALWIHSIEEKGGTLALEGSARDASDLSEFVRRLRASGRFGRVTSPDFARTTEKTSDGSVRNLDWTIGGVVVRRWN